MSEPTVPSFKVPDAVAEEESVKPANDAIRDRLREQSGRTQQEQRTASATDTSTATAAGGEGSETPRKATTRSSTSDDK